MQSIKRRQNGSALLTTLMVSIVLTLVTSVMIGILNDSYNRQAGRTGLERYTNLVLSLRHQLEDPQSCPLLLGDKLVPKNVDTDFTFSKDREIVLNWSYGSSSAPFMKGWRSPDFPLRLDGVIMRRTGDVFNTVRVVTNHVSTTYTTIPIRIYVLPSDISINLGDLKGGPVQPPEQVPEMINPALAIQLHANVDANNKIFSCFGANSFAAACEAVGGAYNYAGPPELRCQPDLICFGGHGGLVNSPAACRNGSIQYRANLVGLVNNQNQYLCTLCHEDL